MAASKSRKETSEESTPPRCYSSLTVSCRNRENKAYHKGDPGCAHWLWKPAAKQEIVSWKWNRRKPHWKAILTSFHLEKVMFTLLPKLYTTRDNGTRPDYDIFIAFPMGKGKFQSIKPTALWDHLSIPHCQFPLPGKKDKLYFFPQRSINCSV